MIGKKQWQNENRKRVRSVVDMKIMMHSRQQKQYELEEMMRSRGAQVDKVVEYLSISSRNTVVPLLQAAESTDPLLLSRSKKRTENRSPVQDSQIWSTEKKQQPGKLHKNGQKQPLRACSFNFPFQVLSMYYSRYFAFESVCAEIYLPVL